MPHSVLFWRFNRCRCNVQTARPCNIISQAMAAPACHNCPIQAWHEASCNRFRAYPRIPTALTQADKKSLKAKIASSSSSTRPVEFMRITEDDEVHGRWRPEAICDNSMQEYLAYCTSLQVHAALLVQKSAKDKLPHAEGNIATSHWIACYQRQNGAGLDCAIASQQKLHARSTGVV